MSIRACILLSTYTPDSQLPFPLIRLFDGDIISLRWVGHGDFMNLVSLRGEVFPFFNLKT